MTDNRKEVKEVLAEIDLDYIYQEELSKFIERFVNIRDAAAQRGFHKIIIETDKKFGYYDDVSFEATVTGWRNETDEEMRARIQRNKVAAEKARETRKKQKEADEKAQRELYLKLKDKYG